MPDPVSPEIAEPKDAAEPAAEDAILQQPESAYQVQVEPEALAEDAKVSIEPETVAESEQQPTTTKIRSVTFDSVAESPEAAADEEADYGCCGPPLGTFASRWTDFEFLEEAYMTWTFKFFPNQVKKSRSLKKQSTLTRLTPEHSESRLQAKKSKTGLRFGIGRHSFGYEKKSLKGMVRTVQVTQSLAPKKSNPGTRTLKAIGNVARVNHRLLKEAGSHMPHLHMPHIPKNDAEADSDTSEELGASQPEALPELGGESDTDEGGATDPLGTNSAVSADSTETQDAVFRKKSSFMNPLRHSNSLIRATKSVGTKMVSAVKSSAVKLKVKAPENPFDLSDAQTLEQRKRRGSVVGGDSMFTAPSASPLKGSSSTANAVPHHLGSYSKKLQRHFQKDPFYSRQVLYSLLIPFFLVLFEWLVAGVLCRPFFHPDSLWWERGIRYLNLGLMAVPPVLFALTACDFSIFDKVVSVKVDVSADSGAAKSSQSSLSLGQAASASSMSLGASDSSPAEKSLTKSSVNYDDSKLCVFSKRRFLDALLFIFVRQMFPAVVLIALMVELSGRQERLISLYLVVGPLMQLTLIPWPLLAQFYVGHYASEKHRRAMLPADGSLDEAYIAVKSEHPYTLKNLFSEGPLGLTSFIQSFGLGPDRRLYRFSITMYFIMLGLVFALWMPAYALRIDILVIQKLDNVVLNNLRGVWFHATRTVAMQLQKIINNKINVPGCRLHLRLAMAANQGLILPLAVAQTQSWANLIFFILTDWFAFFQKCVAIAPLKRGDHPYLKYYQSWINYYGIAPPHGLSTKRGRVFISKTESRLTTIGFLIVICLYPSLIFFKRYFAEAADVESRYGQLEERYRPEAMLYYFLFPQEHWSLIYIMIFFFQEAVQDFVMSFFDSIFPCPEFDQLNFGVGLGGLDYLDPKSDPALNREKIRLLKKATAITTIMCWCATMPSISNVLCDTGWTAQLKQTGVFKPEEG